MSPHKSKDLFYRETPISEKMLLLRNFHVILVQKNFFCLGLQLALTAFAS